MHWIGCVVDVGVCRIHWQTWIKYGVELYSYVGRLVVVHSSVPLTLTNVPVTMEPQAHIMYCFFLLRLRVLIVVYQYHDVYAKARMDIYSWGLNDVA